MLLDRDTLISLDFLGVENRSGDARGGVASLTIPRIWANLTPLHAATREGLLFPRGGYIFDLSLGQERLHLGLRRVDYRRIFEGMSSSGVHRASCSVRTSDDIENTQCFGKCKGSVIYSEKFLELIS
jgi:hypothetical protein